MWARREYEGFAIPMAGCLFMWHLVKLINRNVCKSHDYTILCGIKAQVLRCCQHTWGCSAHYQANSLLHDILPDALGKPDT